MTDCLFCRIANGDIPADIVYKDEQVVVFRDIAPKAEVHLLMIPRLHLDSLNDMSAEHSALISHMMLLLPTLAAEQGLAQGYRTIINTGKGGGQEVFHLHIHIMGGNKLPGFN